LNKYRSLKSEWYVVVCAKHAPTTTKFLFG
jgi:hypothetical protein